MTLESLTLSEVKNLLKDMQENVPEQFDPDCDIFYLALHLENDGTLSGDIHQSIGDGRLWLSIDKIVVDSDSVT
jgi:hypothetical protein